MQSHTRTLYQRCKMASVCPYSDVDPHPLFVYIASDKRFTSHKHLQSLVPYIGVHVNPFDDIRRQNREPGYTGADHTTKEGAGSLQIEIVIGPFVDDEARKFRDEWRKSSRKLVSRVQKGIQQARRYGSNVYCLDVPWASRQMSNINAKKGRPKKVKRRRIVQA